MSTERMTPEQIADRLRTLPPGQKEWNEEMLQFCADTILLVSDPPRKEDGPVPREVLLADRQESGDIAHVVPDWAHHVDSVDVEGNIITLSHTATGTLPNGKRFVGTAKYVFTVEDGRIVKWLLIYDPEQYAAMMEAFPAAEELSERYMEAKRQANA